MAPTKPIGLDPVTGRWTEFIITPSGAGNILDGGNASSTYVGGPTFDCGHAT